MAGTQTFVKSFIQQSKISQPLLLFKSGSHVVAPKMESESLLARGYLHTIKRELFFSQLKLSFWKGDTQEFPGSSAVRTWHFHCHGLGSISLNLRLLKQSKTRPKKTKTVVQIVFQSGSGEKENEYWIPVSMAWASLVFHCSATSFANGSSGLGALNKAWIDSRTVRICSAGDHLSTKATGPEWPYMKTTQNCCVSLPYFCGLHKVRL